MVILSSTRVLNGLMVMLVSVVLRSAAGEGIKIILSMEPMEWMYAAEFNATEDTHAGDSVLVDVMAHENRTGIEDLLCFNKGVPRPSHTVSAIICRGDQDENTVRSRQSRQIGSVMISWWTLYLCQHCKEARVNVSEGYTCTS